jgi:hypothetical protein
MDTAFTFIDRTVDLTFYDQEPVTVRMYLGDALEEKLQQAVGHYDQDHTLEEDMENLKMLVGQEEGAQLLERAEPLDRMAVLELLSFVVRRCREEQGKKLMALAAG